MDAYGYDRLSNVMYGLFVFAFVYYIIMIVMCIIMVIAEWKMYAKAGKPGWAALIPFYNCYVLFQIVYGDDRGWSFLKIFIPLYNIYIMIKLYLDLPKVYGKPAVFGVGLLLLPYVFFPILGFGKSTYIGHV